MADAASAAPEPRPRKRHRWLRALARAVGLVIVLIGAVYWVITRPAFLQKHILPRISRSLNANVTVSSATINPFSQIVLHDLKVQPTNQAPLVTVAEVRVKCNLLDFLRGNFRAQQAVLISPMFQLVENIDGSSNLDPLRKASQERAKQAPIQPAEPLRIDIGKLLVSDGTFRKIQNQKAGTRNLFELTNVAITLTGVKNGGSGHIEFSSVIRGENNPPAPAMYGLLLAKTDGKFDFALAPDLRRESLLGTAHLNISHAAGSFSDFGNLDGTLQCDVSTTEFKSVTLNFEKRGSRLGELRATGPYDAQKAEGRLNVELLSVDKQVLNLFGARYGIDFGSTTITSTNSIELTKAGAAIAVSGLLRANKFQLGRTNESTPPLEVRADYDVSIDKADKTALLNTLNFTGTQNGNPLLRGQLTSPMTLAWGNATNAVGDSSLNLTVTKLNIVDWKSFAGGLASAGKLDLNLNVHSQHGGTELTFDATNRIANLTTQIDGQHITDATVLLRARGHAANLNLFDFKEYSLQLVQSNQPAVMISGSGVYDRSSSNADFQLTLDASLSRALPVLDRPDVAASSGTAELKGRVTQKQQTQAVSGNLTISGLTGKFGAHQFTNYSAAMDLDLEKTPDHIDFHKVSGRVTAGRSSNGNFDASGSYGLTNGRSQVVVNLSDFNQDGLRPFLQPLWPEKKLVSVLLNGTASAQFSPRGKSAVQADVQVSNLVLSSAAQQLLPPPLQAKVQLDATTSKQVLDLHQLRVALPPTERATNQFQLQGRLDMSKSNSIQGSIKLTAGSLDLTGYYDFFNQTNKPTPPKATGTGIGRFKPQPQKTSSAIPPPPPEQPRATNYLPFENFTVEADVREFYFRELDATNLHAIAGFNGSHVLLKPFQVTIGGSPVFATADADMSVPGWNCALTVDGTNVPFAPLWNTFNPRRKGELGGTVTAHGSINGVSTSGETLQKSLAGDFHITATNLNLEVQNVHNRMLIGVVRVAASVPDILRNPLDAALGLVGNIISGKFRGSLSADVEKSPIEVIAVEGTAANGQLLFQQAVVRSAAFEASTTNATITLAPVLTNSAINIPIGIALSRTIAPRISLLNLFSTQTNNDYVKLPDFFSEKGTIGDPKPNIDAVALTKGMIKESIPGIGIGTNTLDHALQSIHALLRGEPNTNEPATNQAAANEPPAPVPGNRTARQMGK